VRQPIISGRDSSKLLRAAISATAISLVCATGYGADRVEEVIVTGKMLDYSIVESANKMPMSVKDTPQSVKVITEDMLEFASVRNFNDLYKLDAGGNAANSGYRQTYHYSRGFSSSPSGGSSGIKVDGFRTATQFIIDLAAFDRIELVKGATSTMYGQASLAGTMNAITKKPKSDSGADVRLELGSYDWRRAELDAYGPLTGDDKLSYRLIGTFTDADNYIDGGFEDSYMLAPSIQYDFTEYTKARLMVAYERSKTSGNAGLGLIEHTDFSYSIPNIDRSRQVYPGWAHQTRDAFFALGSFEHSFAGEWQLRAAATHYRTVSDMASGYVGFTFEEDGSSQFIGEWSITNYLSQGAEITLNGPFELFGQEHRAFVGVDYTQFGSQPSKYASGMVSEVAPFSIYGTDWSAFPEFVASDFLTGGRFAELEDRYVENSSSKNKQLGVTAQLLLKPIDRWSLLLGLRRSDVKVDTGGKDCYGPTDGENECPQNFFAHNSRPPMTENSALTSEKTTYQAGTTFEITDDINIYASYGETFEPREDRQFDPDDEEGRLLGPEEGEAYELGFKGELFDEKMSWSVALFDIARTNVAIPDPFHPDFVIPLGEQRAKGVEVDVQGNITDGLGIYLSLAKIDNEYKDGDLDGFKTNLGPKLGATLFVNYQLQSGALQGLGFGGGLIYKDRATAYDIYYTWPDRASIPSLSTDIKQVDVQVYYDRDAWSYQLSVTNLLDEEYWSVTRDYGLCCMFASAGPEVRFAVNRRFGAAARR
jgi:TonB-dependent siderophore receptor